MRKLTIGHISDTHNKHRQIKWPGDPAHLDVLVMSGDMSGMGRRSEVQAFLKWFAGIETKYKVLVAGNHDLCFDPKRTEQRGENEWSEEGEMPGWLHEALTGYFEGKVEGGFNYYLENAGCTIEGVNFWGSPVTPTFGHGWAFNKNRGLDIAETWLQIPTDTDVLITHGPALGFADWSEMQQLSVGCEELRKAIKYVKPLVHLSGHIHEAQGYAHDADTHYFNGAICNLHGYIPENAPWFIEADFEEREIKILNNGIGEGQKAEDNKGGECSSTLVP